MHCRVFSLGVLHLVYFFKSYSSYMPPFIIIIILIPLSSHVPTLHSPRQIYYSNLKFHPLKIRPITTRHMVYD